MKLFAHRGLSSIFPENTLAAFRACTDHGVNWIETDVNILGDGTVVVIHDSHLERTTNASGSIYNLTAADLDYIDAGAWFSTEMAGERVPTLAELIQLMNQTGLNANIEIKSNEQGAARTRELMSGVLRELEALRPEREVIISSFNHLILAELKRLAPQYRVAALMTKEMMGADWRSVLELIGAETIHLESRGLTENHVKKVKDAGFAINVWTVNEGERASQLKNWGVDGVISDYAHAFRELEHS
ncbi:glycerophosphoryl diester phosphodiesterase [Rothia aerolata]|uniref:Glycerophosphoryl diester phosphodiesterase n=1 Tax=Rothia aerolata TaxID=1812262 RepID=A0A917IRE8_9MICC|nr:glycerophosphoryl diester phosphodiesterase [Rothia aerolata]GGH62172.1 glycerophosphoryl diester phosphodiesterase [Rothia aerolata]